MKLSTIFVMIFSITIVWGGFFFLLYLAMKKNNIKINGGKK